MLNAATIISTILIVAAVLLATRYIYKEKKKGTKCIGCPCAGECHTMHGSSDIKMREKSF
ncbi:MAG: FeoB-associated Cys-rich membrane protein [Mogibacterium sp.]|nr:FeoB-associated Cys-rich membrane protein [Mogibacterium sp.]